MNSYRNRGAARTVTVMVVTTIIAVFFMGMISYRVLEDYRVQENKAVIRMLAQRKTQEPDAELLSYVELLNAETEKVTDSGITAQEIWQELSQYGITEDEYLLRDGKNTAGKILCTGMLLTLAGGGIQILVFLWYVRCRRKKLDGLSRYVEQITAGDYDLGLMDNSEEELSLLKNQLYKLTVMLRQQAENARQQKKALAESVEDISHQLKTPLTSITILLDNLAEKENMDIATRNRFLNEVIRQVQGMNWLIISMLKLSKLDAGVVEFEEKDFLLEPVIAEAARNLEVLSERKGVEIRISRVSENAGEITLHGDVSWNREAIQNVLKNAVEHSNEKTPVTIQIEDNSVYTAITITNEGESISQEQQKQIFSRHYSAVDAGESSMGIGLPLAKGILERQNGYLAVESAQGKTSFVLKYRKQIKQMS